MSVILKKDTWKIKDPNTGEYRDSTVFASTFAEDTATIVAEATAAVDAQEARAEGIVSGAQADIDTIAAAVQSMTQTGTDTTLTVSGAAADAKVVGDKIATYTGVEEIQFTEGYYIATNGATVDISSPVASETGFKYAVLDCVKGDRFTINSSGGSTPRAWCFIDSSGNSIQPAWNNSAYANACITAPANSAKIIINAKNDEKSYRGYFLNNSEKELEEFIKYNHEGLGDVLKNQVILPGDDGTMYHSTGGSYFKRYGNIIEYNQTHNNSNYRFGLTGALGDLGATSAPNFSTRPRWFVDDIPDFIVGHEYYFGAKFLSGTMADSAVLKNFVLFTKDGSLNNKSVAINGTWVCNIKPQCVDVNFGPGTYLNCVWYIYIIDKTLADADVNSLKEYNAENSSRLSYIKTSSSDIIQTRNAMIDQPLQSLLLDLPLNKSSSETPSLSNVVSYTPYDSVAVSIGEQYDTATETKSIALSEVQESIYGGSIDFAKGVVKKKYDYLLLDGVTDGLKFTETTEQYRIVNNKLKTAVATYMCKSSWLNDTVLRVNASSGFTYGYKTDFESLGFTTLSALNSQIAQTPLYVIFELAEPVEYEFETEPIYLENANSVIWTGDGTVSATYNSSFENSSVQVVDANRTNTYHISGNISSLPKIKVPSTMHYSKIPYFYDIIGNIDSMNKYYRTNGICYDGVRYMYYALGAEPTYTIRKFDTWKKEVVLSGERSSENGHHETLTFVPSWCPGFDNGTVDRIYETTLDSVGTIKVFDADTLEYLTSFATNTLINSEYYTTTHRMLFNQNRGKFVFCSGVATVNNVGYTTMAIYDLNGTIEKCVRFKDKGTGCGLDSDDYFIYYLKDMNTTPDPMLVIDWDLNPVAMAPFTCKDYEPEGLCHIGDVFYMLANVDNRGGVHIWEYHCTNSFFNYSQTFPLSSWDDTKIDSSTFAEIQI